MLPETALNPPTYLLNVPGVTLSRGSPPVNLNPDAAFDAEVRTVR